MYEVPVCVVCLEGLCRKLACAPCGHVFHEPCIKNCLQNNPSCPLCREKLNITNLVTIAFEITEKNTNIIQKNYIIPEIITEKLKILEKKLESKQSEAISLTESNQKSLKKLSNIKKKYSISQGLLKNSEFQYQVLENSYKATKSELEDCKSLLQKLENLKNFLSELENNNSPAPWISNIMQSFSLEDQIFHFHSSLLITSNLLKNNQETLKALKQEHLLCEQKISELKKKLSGYKRASDPCNNPEPYTLSYESLPKKVKNT
jgi:DNA repair exonuclease SbcCD ATPase subunit